ncbi:MAG: hypothetical protein CVU05_02625 [Bacteroidetes bacterium HGW-Bacteroidetes-21]|nr:MAG: hypothetical protein CVU05_02625 [Bacteroidetes bacterium HGW-Bacteroidetes-21]
MVVFSVCILNAQNASSDFKKINSAYLKTSYTADVCYSVFQSSADITPLQSETGYYKLNASEKKTCMKLGQYYLINTPDFSFTLNSIEKFISFSKNKANTKLNSNSYKNTELMLKMVDTLLHYSKSVKYNEISSKLGEYILFPGFGDYNKVRIRFDRYNFLITEIEFFYKRNQNLTNIAGKEAKPRLKIVYSNIVVNPTFTKDDFSYLQYLNESDGKYSLKSSYSNYTLSCN